MLLGVASCSYSPPNAADVTKPNYQADLKACEEFGDKEGHRRVMAFGGLFLSYPISLPIEEYKATRKCMEGKGYVAA
jgi:hypothetical protein